MRIALIPKLLTKSNWLIDFQFYNILKRNAKPISHLKLFDRPPRPSPLHQCHLFSHLLPPLSLPTPRHPPLNRSLVILFKHIIMIDKFPSRIALNALFSSLCKNTISASSLPDFLPSRSQSSHFNQLSKSRQTIATPLKNQSLLS